MWKDILKSAIPLIFHFGIRKWENVTVDQMYVISRIFMLMCIVQKPTDAAIHTIIGKLYHCKGLE